MRPAALVLVLGLLAGCAADPGPSAEEAAAEGAVVFVEDYALGNATVSKEDLQNATLGPEHAHDAWSGADALVLLDDTLEAGLCEGPFDAAAYAAVALLSRREVAYGCVRASLPEGVLVPEGAGALTVEIDATASLKSGSLALQWRNKAREEEAEPTAEPRHAWRIDLASADWDVPHAPATTFVLYVAARGPAGYFEGPVHVRVTAHRLPGWEPVLALAHVDHWKLPALHDFPAPGVMRLLDAEGRVANVDPARFTGGAAHEEGIPLADIVAPGAAWLTIVSDTTSTDCAPGLQCHLVPLLHVGGHDRDRHGALLLEEGARRVYAWKAPDEVPHDSVYQEASTARIEPRIDACVVGVPDSCGLASIASGSATARLQAFAWKGEVDLALLERLAG